MEGKTSYDHHHQGTDDVNSFLNQVASGPSKHMGEQGRHNTHIERKNHLVSRTDLMRRKQQNEQVRSLFPRRTEIPAKGNNDPRVQQNNERRQHTLRTGKLALGQRLHNIQEKLVNHLSNGRNSNSKNKNSGQRDNGESKSDLYPIQISEDSNTPIKYGPIVGISVAGKKPRHPTYPNQDVLAIAACAPSASGCAILSIVCDGHGKFGHNVSHFVRDRLMQELLPLTGNMGNLLPKDITKLHKQAYKNVAHDLLYSSAIDTQFSGTTVSTAALVAGYSKLVISHVGDSRVVLGKLSSQRDRVIAIDLAHDHKPDLPNERARIASKGGVVTTTPKDKNGNPIGSSRVWRRGLRGPGLAMSRSLGDHVAHSVGVSGEPDVTCIQLGFPDMFVIVASDGIWEFISSQEAVDLVMDTCGAELNTIASMANTQGPSAASTSDVYTNNFVTRPDGGGGDGRGGEENVAGTLLTGPQTKAAVLRLCSLANQRWRSFSGNTTIDDITCAIMLLPRV